MTGRYCTRHSTPYQHRAAVHELRLAAQNGDASAIAALLDPSVEMVTDGGGRAPVDTRLVRGPANVARRICDVLEQQPAKIAEREVNGQSGLVLSRQGRVAAVVSVSVRHKRVTDLWVILNPDKLRHWNR